MVIREIIERRALQIDDSDHSSFVDQRHHEFRFRLGVDRDVSRILGDVTHADRLVVQSGRPHQALTQRHCQFPKVLFVGADNRFGHQDACAFVELKQGEDVIVDHRFHGPGDVMDNFIDIERGAHFETQLVEQRQRLAVPALAFVEPRVLDGDRELAGQ